MCTAAISVLLTVPAAAQAPAAPQASTQVQAGNTRSGMVGPAAIGFIDSPNAYCSQPDPALDICYVNWSVITVDAAPDYMIELTIELPNGTFVARNQGFFQTSMTIPATMNDRGFKKACGKLGASGDPEWGNAYTWTIRAKDSNSAEAANYGVVHCPAYKGPTRPQY